MHWIIRKNKAPHTLIRNFVCELSFKMIQVSEMLLLGVHKIAVSGAFLVSIVLAGSVLSSTEESTIIQSIRFRLTLQIHFQFAIY